MAHPSPTGRALVQIANIHTEDTVISLVFSRPVAGDRASRFAFHMAAQRMPHDVAIDDFVFRSYFRPEHDHWQQPCRIPPNAIAFSVSGDGCVHDSDIINVGARSPCCAGCWCILDVRAADPFRIIPANIVVPYADSPSPYRLNKELDRTDMLPLWFWNEGRTLGVPITSGAFDSLSDGPTRIEVTSLKVAIWVSQALVLYAPPY